MSARRTVVGLLAFALVVGAVHAAFKASAQRKTCQIGGLETPHGDVAVSAPARMQAEPIELLPVYVEAVAPRKQAAPLHVKRCSSHALKVTHEHALNVDVQIAGDSSVTICEWSTR